MGTSEPLQQKDGYKICKKFLIELVILMRKKLEIPYYYLTIHSELVEDKLEEILIWIDFLRAFRGKYIEDDYMNIKKSEFLKLKQK